MYVYVYVRVVSFVFFPNLREEIYVKSVGIKTNIYRFHELNIVKYSTTF